LVAATLCGMALVSTKPNTTLALRGCRRCGVAHGGEQLNSPLSPIHPLCNLSGKIVRWAAPVAQIRCTLQCNVWINFQT
jgi:hypothetical protein